MNKPERSEYKEKIGKRIEGLAGERRGGKAELSRAIGVSPTNISNYFKGKLPDPEVLEKIADYFRVSLAWLLTGKEEFASERGRLSGEEKDLINYYHGMDKEDQKRWKETGKSLFEKKVNADTVQHISKSASKQQTEKHSKKTSKG